MIVYTAIYGGYDQLKPHPESDVVHDWICYTDDPELVCDGWQTVVEPSRFDHPRLAAKWRKCHPPTHRPRSLWVDGSMVIDDPSFFDSVAGRLEAADIVMFAHPERTSIIDEAEISEQMVKYFGLPVMKQAEHYIDQWGWPDLELWASTTIGRNVTPDVSRMGAAWFAENEHWTYQDQISLPPVLARYGIRPAPLPYSLWRNPWFRLASHASDQ